MARFQDNRNRSAGKGRLLGPVHFSIPGNTRWNCPILYSDSELSRRVESILRKRSGITEVTANPVTGRLRVLYLPTQSQEEVAPVCEASIREAMAHESVAAGMSSAAIPGPWPARRDTSDAALSEGAKPLLVTIGIGAGTVATWLVTRAALRVFPRSAVFAGLAIFAGSTATLAVLLNRQPVDDRIKRDRDHAVRELWRVARPYRPHLAMGLAMVVIGRAFQVAAVAIVGVIIDSAISTGGVTALGVAVSTQPLGMVPLAFIALALIASCALFDYYSRLLWMRTAHNIAYDLRLSLYSHIQSIEMAELTDANRGTYLALLNDDINRIELLFGAIWAVSREVSYGAISVLAFFMVDAAFAGMVTVPLPALLLLSYSLEKEIRPRYAALREEAGQLHGLLSSSLDGIETTRAFATEAGSLKRVAGASERYRQEQNSVLTIVTSYDPAVLAAANGLRVATCIAAGFYAAAGNMTIGSYVTLVTLATSLALPLRGIARDFPHILSSLASLSRVFEAFRIPTENRTLGVTLAPNEVKGELRFENVSFTYPGGHEVLREFSVDIPAGNVTAFVGATGSGKSTLAKLLLRFYDPTGGRISLDERNIQTIGRVHVRRNIGYVGQDVFLFNGSIHENIALGRPEADFESIAEAARVAGAHDFISNLPAGYDTVVGERGIKLSGGERQRVGIARALLLQRQIVILDEATSALDPVTEATLAKELAGALAGRTVIVIAHRLSAVRNAYRIHVIDSGAIVEAGTHDELLKLRGRYARFWALQTHDLDAFRES
jgi:ATP-binding cassette subfamily B protein